MVRPLLLPPFPFGKMILAGRTNEIQSLLAPTLDSALRITAIATARASLRETSRPLHYENIRLIPRGS